MSLTKPGIALWSFGGRLQGMPPLVDPDKEPQTPEQLRSLVETLRLELEREKTLREHAEAVAKSHDEVLQRFMDHSPIYVFFKDTSLRSIRLSKNYEQLLGRPVSEILGKTMEEIFPLEFARKIVADDLAILEAGRAVVINESFNGRHYTTIKFPILYDGVPKYLAGYTIDVTEQFEAGEALRVQNAKLEEALSSVKTLRGLLPICSSCKKIRDDQGYWNQVEYYIQRHSDATFTHGCCPECVKKLYPDLEIDLDEKPENP